LFFFIAATGPALEPAHPQTPGGKAANSIDKDNKFTNLRGEWHRAGAGFACVVKPPEELRSDRPCPTSWRGLALFSGP
jgi:hypothetical protein